MQLVNNFVFMLVFVFATVMFATGADSTTEIDFRVVLVSAPAIKFLGGTGSAGGVGGPDTAVIEPITVAIVDLQLSDCDSAERYANVQLSNSGSSPIRLPWSPDGARVVVAQGTADDQIPFDTLHVTLRSKRKPTVSVTRTLFGSLFVPGSQAMLLPGHSVLLRNIDLQSAGGSLCGADVVAEVAFSTNRASKSAEGYSLISQEKWRVQSQ